MNAAADRGTGKSAEGIMGLIIDGDPAAAPTACAATSAIAAIRGEDAGTCERNRCHIDRPAGSATGVDAAGCAVGSDRAVVGQCARYGQTNRAPAITGENIVASGTKIGRRERIPIGDSCHSRIAITPGATITAARTISIVVRTRPPWSARGQINSGGAGISLSIGRYLAARIHRNIGGVEYDAHTLPLPIYLCGGVLALQQDCRAARNGHGPGYIYRRAAGDREGR